MKEMEYLTTTLNSADDMVRSSIREVFDDGLQKRGQLDECRDHKRGQLDECRDQKRGHLDVDARSQIDVGDLRRGCGPSGRAPVPNPRRLPQLPAPANQRLPPRGRLAPLPSIGETTLALDCPVSGAAGRYHDGGGGRRSSRVSIDYVLSASQLFDGGSVGKRLRRSSRTQPPADDEDRSSVLDPPTGLDPIGRNPASDDDGFLITRSTGSFVFTADRQCVERTRLTRSLDAETRSRTPLGESYLSARRGVIKPQTSAWMTFSKLPPVGAALRDGSRDVTSSLSRDVTSSTRDVPSSTSRDWKSDYGGRF